MPEPSAKDGQSPSQFAGMIDPAAFGLPTGTGLFTADAESLLDRSDTSVGSVPRAGHTAGDAESPDSQEPSALLTAALPLALLGIAVSSARRSRTARIQGGPPRPTLTFSRLTGAPRS